MSRAAIPVIAAIALVLGWPAAGLSSPPVDEPGKVVRASDASDQPEAATETAPRPQASERKTYTDLPVYVRPSRGSPQARVGGATRGGLPGFRPHP